MEIILAICDQTNRHDHTDNPDPEVRFQLFFLQIFFFLENYY